MLISTFHRNEQGSIAILFALVAVIATGIVGAAVDYSRASSLRSAIQHAADAAALAAVGDPESIFSQRKQIAENVAAGHIKAFRQGSDFDIKVIELPDGGVSVAVEATSGNTFFRVLGKKTTPVFATAESQAQLMNAEIALVLDNTGSMENDMEALRSGVAALIDKLVTDRSAGNIRLSVVPYVAAVNPGRDNLPMWMMDTAAASQHHGRLLRNRWTYMWREAFQRCINRGVSSPRGSSTAAGTTIRSECLSTKGSFPSAPPLGNRYQRTCPPPMLLVREFDPARPPAPRIQPQSTFFFKTLWHSEIAL